MMWQERAKNCNGFITDVHTITVQVWFGNNPPKRKVIREKITPRTDNDCNEEESNSSIGATELESRRSPENAERLKLHSATLNCEVQHPQIRTQAGDAHAQLCRAEG